MIRMGRYNSPLPKRETKAQACKYIRYHWKNLYLGLIIVWMRLTMLCEVCKYPNLFNIILCLPHSSMGCFNNRSSVCEPRQEDPKACDLEAWPRINEIRAHWRRRKNLIYLKCEFRAGKELWSTRLGESDIYIS
jgi:hypothetical protein